MLALQNLRKNQGLTGTNPPINPILLPSQSSLTNYMNVSPGRSPLGPPPPMRPTQMLSKVNFPPAPETLQPQITLQPAKVTLQSAQVNPTFNQIWMLPPTNNSTTTTTTTQLNLPEVINLQPQMSLLSSQNYLLPPNHLLTNPSTITQTNLPGQVGNLPGQDLNLPGQVLNLPPIQSDVYQDQQITYDAEKLIIAQPMLIDDSIQQVNVKRMLNFSDVYLFVAQLGTGHYGVVSSYIERDTRKIYAIKEMELSPTLDIARLEDEMTILKTITKTVDDNFPGNKYYRENSPIVKYYNSFVYGYGSEAKYAIVMEYIKGYSLEKYIKEVKKFGMPTPTKVIVSTAFWLLSTIKLIHDIGFVHRDVKPDNIMVDIEKGRLVLIDFGFSCAIDVKYDLTCNANLFLGSPIFLAPERFLGISKLPDSKDYWFKASDIWAAGIVIYYLLEHKFPYRAKTFDNLKIEIKKPNQITISLPNSDRLRVLIERILNKNVEQRPTSEEVLNLIKSLFYSP